MDNIMWYLCPVGKSRGKKEGKSMHVLINEMPYRPNVQLMNPSSIMQLNKSEKQMQFTFQARDIVNMYITFPRTGGVRIRNDKLGMFEPKELCSIQYQEIDEQTLKMSGNGTSVILTNNDDKWELAICDRNDEQKTVITSGVGLYKQSNFKIGVNIDEKPSLYRVFFPISEGEEFFGFGERFDELKQDKRELLMWNTDVLVLGGGVYSDLAFDNCEKTQAYKNIPLIHSTNQYSMFFNSYLPITFDIGKSYPNRLRTEIYGTQFDVYIWTDAPSENLLRYHELTGTPFIPPKWAFDYWMGGGHPIWNTPDKSHAFPNLTKALDTYKSHGVKINQAYLETDPTEEILGGLRDRGVRTFMWTNSCLPAFGKSKLNYDEYRVKKASKPDEVMRYNYIDFTDEKSKEVIRDKFNGPWDLGVCGEMVDFADSMPEDALCSNGKTGTQMHNEYAYWYGRRMHEAFRERLGDEFVLFQRSGCAGSQHYTASFGGDSFSSFLGLKRSVWQMLSAAASGISVWGSDVGGFALKGWMTSEGPDFEELYMRWVQFGTFSPLMRDHSWHGKHHPWANGERGLKNFQNYYALRMRLLDQIYSAAIASETNGGTMVNSMAMAYNMSPSVDMQYMFCNELLVRPIVELGQRTVNVIIPEDGYCDFYTGEAYEKGEHEVEAPIEQIPVFVRPGAVIAYNYYPEDVIPTFEKDKYEEALLLTKPTDERNITFYQKGAQIEFNYNVQDGKYNLKADRACERKVILLLGMNVKDVVADTEIEDIFFDEKKNQTMIRLKDAWTNICYQTLPNK